MDENSHAFIYIVAHDAERNKDGDDESYPFQNNYKHIWRKVVYWLIVLLRTNVRYCRFDKCVFNLCNYVSTYTCIF